MATNKNITMKQFNGTDYDTLYPKTIASQIPDVYSKSYIDSILKDNARIQAGSYVGTGTYGVDNPCTLTFDFSPKVIAFNTEDPYYKVFLAPILIKGLTYINYISSYLTSNGNIKYETLHPTWGNNFVNWYGRSEMSQLNGNNITYNYIAIG